MTGATTLVDLEIRVATESIQGRTFLRYVLDSPNGAIDMDHVSIRNEAFAGRPDAYQAALIKKIELLHAGLDIDRRPLLKHEVKSKLEGIGRDLYHELFPPPMRTLYRKFRTRVQTLVIISDEPWIPWELIKPYDDTDPDEIIDDDFFCGRFRLTRWLAGGKAAPATIYAGKIACIEVGELPEARTLPPLPHAAEERAVIAGLARSHPPAMDVSPSAATNEAIERLLKTDALGLLHIVGHGEFVPEQPNESSILLVDGRSFRAGDLQGPTATQIGRNRPLVFLNACRVAQQGWSLTGLGGWVERWVRRCGCGGFIGPQWVVNDRLAYEFACTFYRAVEGGESLGQAAWAARNRVRKLDPGNPSWLAFSVFAHPEGRILFERDQMQGSSFTAAELSTRGIALSESPPAGDSSLGPANVPSLPEPYFAHRYTLLQTRDLVGRRAELDDLTEWVSHPDVDISQARVLNIVAIGGMGKSALAWKWFNNVAGDKMKPLAGRLWWSFYEHDATFEKFIMHTLAYASGRSISAIRQIPRPDRETELLEILDRLPFLIVLDGLERIMIAYARMDAARMMDDDLDQKAANVVAGAMGLPASVARSFVGQHRLRKTQDPRAGAFLRKLADVRASRILVSTRLYPAELQDPFTWHAVPGSVAYPLKGLRGADSLKLWKALGVRGQGHQVLPILDRIEHHPLVIRALAGEVACYRRAPGNFDQWREDHPDFDPSQLPLVQARSHVLAFALRGLCNTSHRVAQTIAAFRMPASYDSLSAILATKAGACDDEADLNAALADLEDRGLTGWDRETNQYDMHPLVRGVIWSGLSNRDKQAVYEDLHSHFEAMPALYQYQVADSRMLTPAIELCNSLANLKRYDDAYLIYHTRIHDAVSNYLNSHQAIEILELFFPAGTDQPPELSKKSCREEAMVYLADAYRTNGQLKRASVLLHRLIEISGKADDLGAVGYGLGQLNGLLLCLGVLREAEESARRALNINRKLERPNDAHGNLMRLGQILLTRGEARLAQSIFKQERARTGDHMAVDSDLAACALRLGDPGAAGALADRALEAVAASPSYERSEKQSVQILHLQGRSMLELGDLTRGGKQLHESLVRARAINDIEGEVQALVALAEAYRRQDEIDTARELLECVWEPVERGPFTLFHADACNVLAQLESEADHSAAIEAATAAFRLAWCDGPPFAYHWGLMEAQARLRSLGVPNSEMPPFDDKEYRPMEEVAFFPDPSSDTDG
ncbi:MAG: CHAT domain-containing protein [bacterium]|nr:CHAT domain-containing protein [bacterium]